MLQVFRLNLHSMKMYFSFIHAKYNLHFIFADGTHFKFHNSPCEVNLAIILICAN